MNRCKTVIVNGASIDGKISPAKNISSKEFSPYVIKDLEHIFHKIRSSCDGIMVSVNTIISDNSSLTVRGTKSNKRPKRIILDRRGRIPKDCKVLNEDAPTVIITSKEGKSRLLKKIKNRAKIFVCQDKDNKLNLGQVLRKLKILGLNKVLIEPGGKISETLFEKNLVDEYIVFIFPIIIGGKNTPTLVDGDGFYFKKIPILKLKKSLKIKDFLMNTYVVRRD